MSERAGHGMPPAVALALLGTLVPVVVAGVGLDLLELYLDGRGYVATAVLAYGLVAWGVVTTRDLDDVNVVVASVVVPAPTVFALVVGASLLEDGTGMLRYLVPDVGALFALAAGYALAGVAAVWARRRVERVVAESRSLSSLDTVVRAVAAVVVLAVVVAAGANYVAAEAATVASISPADEVPGRPAFAVTLDDGAADVRVTVTAPDGTRHTTRVARGDFRNRTATTVVEAAPTGSAPEPGTYRVRVESAAGVTVDRRRFRVDRVADLTLVNVTAGCSATPIPERYDGVTLGHERRGTWVAVEVHRSAGTFEPSGSLRVLVAGEWYIGPRVDAADRDDRPMVYWFPADVVRRVHERADGVVAIQVQTYGEPTGQRSVRLPVDCESGQAGDA